MKIGPAVVGAHIAVLCAFTLTQGCLTTGTQGVAGGARVKGPFKHEHKGKTEVAVTPMQPGMPTDMGDGTGVDIYQPVILDTPITPSAGTDTSATETYIVRKGDTISQLAVDFDTTKAELVRLNKIANPDVLYAGTELLVPAGRGGASSKSSSKSSSVKKGGGTYTIQKGDTLSEIAIAAGVSIDSLRELNGIKGDMIRAGDTLEIPAGGKIPAIKKSTPKSTKPKTETKTEPKVAPVQEATPPAADLQLPDLAKETEAAPEGAAPASMDVFEDRVLYPGETLDDIAREYGISKAEIMRLNGITDETQVRDGQRLRIPISE